MSFEFYRKVSRDFWSLVTRDRGDDSKFGQIKLDKHTVFVLLYLSHSICLCIFLNSNDSHPGGVVSQGSLTVPPTKPLVDLIAGPASNL